MSEADDVLRSIDQLRRDLSVYHGQLKAHNDLQTHCDNQRKRIGELEVLYAKVKAEAAGLRELVRDMYSCISHANEADWFHFERDKLGCGMSCTVNGEACGLCALADRMRELGIETGDGVS